MREISDLINTVDSAWDDIQLWLNSAKNKVEVLPVEPEQAKSSLYKAQVTTRSPMGAVIYHTGGLLIDHGWLRILGGGSTKLQRSLPDWNLGKAYREYGEQASFLLIADDVVGGFFFLNGGAFGEDLGKVYYLSPRTLEFESLNVSYTEFLQFCLLGEWYAFYSDCRWSNWQQDSEQLKGDFTFSFYPFLWSEEGQDIEKVSKQAVPVEEAFNFLLQTRCSVKE